MPELVCKVMGASQSQGFNISIESHLQLDTMLCLCLRKEGLSRSSVDRHEEAARQPSIDWRCQGSKKAMPGSSQSLPIAWAHH